MAALEIARGKVITISWRLCIQRALRPNPPPATTHLVQAGDLIDVFKEPKKKGTVLWSGKARRKYCHWFYTKQTERINYVSYLTITFLCLQWWSKMSSAVHFSFYIWKACRNSRHRSSETDWPWSKVWVLWWNKEQKSSMVYENEKLIKLFSKKMFLIDLILWLVDSFYS